MRRRTRTAQAPSNQPCVPADGHRLEGVDVPSHGRRHPRRAGTCEDHQQYGHEGHDQEAQGRTCGIERVLEESSG
jgi:hypothetical protein